MFFFWPLYPEGILRLESRAPPAPVAAQPDYWTAQTEHMARHDKVIQLGGVA